MMMSKTHVLCFQSSSLDRVPTSTSGLENALRDKTRENIELQSRAETQSAEFSAK